MEFNDNENMYNNAKMILNEEQFYLEKPNLNWCDYCNVPMYKDLCPLCNHKTRYLTADLRPVFLEEAVLFEILLHRKGEFRGRSVWSGTGNRLFVDGKHIPFSVQEITRTWDPSRVSRLLHEELSSGVDIGQEEFAETIEKFIKANAERLQKRENDSFQFVQFVSEKYAGRIKMVSFSGGKDSTVVSSIVRRALGTNDILHVFGNTTLEFPLTYEYVKQFKKRNRRIPFVMAKSNPEIEDNNSAKFIELCNKIGPPSRVMRWCCTTFKTGPISSLIDRFRGDKSVLTFYGIRSSESAQRSKYNEISISPKIAKQIVASPIMDWSDLDVWLYLLTHNEDFNEAYRQGFSRVGCWCCPNNSDWAFFLARVLITEQAEGWRNFLVDFAKKIGKPDAEEYIDSGNWKARQGGNGMDVGFNIVKFQPCATEQHSRNYILTKPITKQLYEYFKPFGNLSFERGKKLLGEVYIIDRRTGKELIILQGKEGKNHLKIIVADEDTKNILLLLQRLDCQIRKYQSCIACQGCPAICKHKAITLLGDQYSIDAKKCTGCLECIAYYSQGCLVAKVTKTGRE